MEDKINTIMKELSAIQIRNDNLKEELTINENIISKLNNQLEELIEYTKVKENAPLVDNYDIIN